MTRALAALIATVGAAMAGPARANGTAPHRRPASADVAPPSPIAEVKLPKAVPTEPPAKAWWSAAAPCPEGTTLDTQDTEWISAHGCRDQGGRQGPYTELDRDGQLIADGWYRNGSPIGIRRRAYHGNVFESTIVVDGVKWGPALESGESGAYRNGVRHGLWQRRAPSGGGIETGFYINGKREGRWLTHLRFRGQDIVIAEAHYRHDAIDGEVVWWTERGDLLAVIHKRRWQFYRGEAKPTRAFDCAAPTDALARPLCELTDLLDPQAAADVARTLVLRP